MWLSKFFLKAPLSLFTYFAVVGLLTSCLRSASNPSSPGNTQDTSADFLVVEVTGRSTPTAGSDPWQIPTAKDYEFRACMISRVTNAPLPIGQVFRVTAPNGSSVEAETDNLGCLNFNETVPFNYAADSMYIEKRRTLVSQGTYRGSSELRFAVNPWLQYRGDAGNEVVDLLRGNTNIPANRLIQEGAGEAALSGMFSRSNSRNLFLDLMPGLELIEVGDLPDGKLFDIIVQLKPYIEPLNLNSDRVKTYFNTGRFKVYVQLVADYVGESQQPQRVVLAPEIAPQEVDINTDGTIVFRQTRVPLRRRVTSGQVQLAVRVELEDSPDGFDLNPYEGLYNAGPYSSLFQKASVTQIRGTQEHEGFDYAHHIETATNFSELREAGWAQHLPPVEYSNLDPRFVQVKQGETSTNRTVIYRVATQVTDGVHGGIVRDQPFTVVHPNGTEEVVMSDHQGYLYWRDELPHLYYMREHRILQKVEIIHHRSRNKANHIIALNPWDEGWTFGADVRSGILAQEYGEDGNLIEWQELSDEELDRRIAEKQEQIARFQALKPNLLFIDAFRYQTIRFRYVIDEFLTLNVKKAVVMALDPLVQRDTLYRGRIFEPLRDGVYLAKIALVKYFIDPFQNGVRLVKCDPEIGNCPCPENERSCDPNMQKYHVRQVSDGGDARKGQYTTVIKKLIRVQAGRITTPLEFSMRDLRMMSIRSNIMVQLETIDERALLRDNIIEQRLQDLERQYFELRPETMTAEEREQFQEAYGYLPEQLSEEELQRIIAERAAEFEQQRQALLDFVRESAEQLNATREAQSAAQLRRFQLVEQIEQGLGTGNPQSIYEQEDPLISLPRGQFDEMLERARANMGRMELEMKQHWSEWDQQWDDVVAGIHHGDYILENETFRRTYFDYLLVAQTFLMNQGVEGVVLSEADLDRFRINNYTQNPVAPMIDLNLYRNRSGLMRRTFIGPCTLVENDNMSEMRPTDTVDEKYCDRIDCGETLYEPRTPLPDNSEFENSAHHDSLKPFASMHVDEVIQIHKENERMYEMNMDALSQMGNYSDAFNLTYVSLTDQPLTVYRQGCGFEEGENCLQETQENRLLKNDFVNVLNEETLPNLLGRYFRVNPPHRLNRINEQVIREDSLEPLWNRARENPGIVASFLFGDETEVPLDYSTDPGYVYGMASNRYLREHYGEIIDQSVNAAKVSSWLHGGLAEMKLEDSLRLCYALGKQIGQQLASNGLISSEGLQKDMSFDPMNAVEKYLIHKCFAHIRYLPQSGEVYWDGVHFDRRYKILKAGSYEHIRGMNMNINVGVDFGISSYDDISTSTSAGVNDAGVIGMTGAGIGAYFGGIPGAVIGAGAGLLVASMTSNRTDGVSMSQGTSVNAATFLVVQKADFDITILEHEKCLTLNFGRELVESMEVEKLHLREGITVTNPSVQDSLYRGYMICDGQVTDTPDEIRESYYYVTQHFTAGDMLDDVNLLNHVWLLALRGQRDYNEFMRILRSKQLDSNGEVIEDRELYDYPLSRLGRVYRQVVPTFPGLYSVQN